MTSDDVRGVAGLHAVGPADQEVIERYVFRYLHQIAQGFKPSTG